jgi:Protein of unknown function (DUF998)
MNRQRSTRLLSRTPGGSRPSALKRTSPRNHAPLPFYRARLACGLLGPAVFTAAWLACTARQQGREGYSLLREHISGLGASDARDPGVMNAGFLTLGACSLAFASAVAEAVESRGAARFAPWVLGAAGAASLGAGLLRRDRMLLQALDGTSSPAPSWHNRAHDLVSAVGYACVVTGPALLGSHPARSDKGRAGRVTSMVTAATLTLFASRLVEDHNGVIQRLAVSVPLASMARVAWSLLGEELRPAPRRRSRR